MLRTLRRKLMISHQFHRGWDCSAGYRGCSGTAGGKKCHWKKCSRNQIFTFLSFLQIIPKMHHLTSKGRSKIRVADFLHKGRSIEIYNKQCLVLSICKNSWCSLFIVQIGLFSWLTSWITLRVRIKASSVEISSQRAVCWLLQAGEI